MGRISLSEVSLGSDPGRAVRFVPGLNLIEGPTGTGKSSLLELVKYTLGGEGKITSAIREGAGDASVAIAFDKGLHFFRRTIGARNITVNGPDMQYVYDVKSREGREQISDLLLSLAGLPAVRIPRSRRKPGKEATRISFYDYWEYFYLQQTEIDRSVMHHLEGYREPKRRATIELLFGLSTPEASDLQVREGQARDKIARYKTSIEGIRNFLARTPLASEESLRTELSRVTADLLESRAQLENLRKSAASGSDAEEPERERLRTLYKRLRDLETSQEEKTAEVDLRRQSLAQLQLDAERSRKTQIAEAQLVPFEFRLCPNCAQSVARSRAGDANCYLCLQALHSSLDDDNENKRRMQARAQAAEIEELLDISVQEAQEIAQEVTAQKQQLQEAELELDRKMATFVSPLIEKIQASAAKAAYLQARREQLGSLLTYWQELRSIEADLDKAEKELAEVQSALRQARSTAHLARTRIDDLSTIFREVLEFIKFPWYESARIDSTTYLPIVNEQKYENLTAGSGGMPTLVNDAYHLAGLVYSLRTSDSLLPRFLIIDSLRKGLGQHAENLNTISLLYRYLRRLSDTYEGKFQLIVADNDVPEEYREYIQLSLSYEDPLVPGISHPGEGMVETIGGEGDTAGGAG